MGIGTDWIGRSLVACALVISLGAGAAEMAGEQGQVSAEARHVARWVQETQDAAGRPYAVVDKRAARLFLFDARHRLVGDTAVLLGSARGDHSAPGVGLDTQRGYVPPAHRTSPAGRFETKPGRNLDGEPVVWVDYAAAFAIHRLRPGAGLRTRQARLLSPSAQDNRVSLGCVVVPVSFYEKVIQPLLGRTRGVVYVLPETQRVQGFFDAL